jgi:hypothetical protein
MEMIPKKGHFEKFIISLGRFRPVALHRLQAVKDALEGELGASSFLATRPLEQQEGASNTIRVPAHSRAIPQIQNVPDC